MLNTTDRKPLTEIDRCGRVCIRDIAGGRALRQRLSALGLTPGTEIQVISGGCGPLRLKVRDCDLVLGRGMAENVFVSALSRN